MEAKIFKIQIKCERVDCYLWNRCVLAHAIEELKDKIKYTPEFVLKTKKPLTNEMELICMDLVNLEAIIK